MSVVIPNSVSSIGKLAFYGCDSLESITIPHVGAMKDGSSDKHFGYIFGATNVGDNSYYVPKTLKTVIITGGTSIVSNAFDGCSSLVNIEIPNSVISIGTFAFSGCSSLISIEIPKSVTNIGEQAFRDCRSIESIEYGGTKAEWKDITRGSNWNFYTGNYTVTCTDGTLSKSESKL